MFFANHRNEKLHFRKIMAFLMVIIMLVSFIWIPAEASITVTKDNSPEENQGILDTLRQLSGDDISAQEAQQKLELMGLLDKNGELALSATVDMDGKQLTLSEIRELVNSESVDLSKVVSVDGTPITLGELKTMIQIEDEIQRIKDTYFSDVTLNEAQQQALDSLRAQIASEGIKILSGETPALVFPSGIDHSIYAEVDTTPLALSNGSGDQSVSVTLKDSSGTTLTAVPNYDISISYRFADGSAKSGTNYSGTDGTMTFAANSTETSKTISFNIANDSSRFEGQKVFLIQFYNPQNVLFQGGKRAAEKPVKIQGSYVWAVIRQFAAGTAYNPTPGYLGDIKMLWQVNNYASLMASDMFIEGLYDKVELDLQGSLSIDDVGSTQTGGPASITPRVVFGYPGIYSKTYSDGFDGFPAIEFTYPAYPGQVGTRTISYKEYILYDPAMLSYIRDAEGRMDINEHGQIFLDLPGSYFGNLSSDFKLSFFDSKNPTVKTVTMPTGKTFEYGQSIPITVEYSEPVNLASATLTANEQVLTAAESGSRGTRFATFLYPVKQVDGVSLIVSNIAGAMDLYGNTQVNYETTQEAADIIKGINKADAFTIASAAATLNINNDGMAGTVTIDLAEAVPEWVTTEAAANNYQVPSIYASIDGGATKIDLYANADNPTALEGSFTDALNTTGAAITKVVEFFLNPEMISTTNHQLMIGSYAAYEIPPVVFLAEGDFDITYDDFPNDDIAFAEDGKDLKLGISVDATGATWVDKANDFAWSSSDPTIAVIDSSGNISITGTPGTVSFTLTAKNGGIEGKAVSVTSRSLTVKVGLTPFLKIPPSANVISIKNGDSAEVRWISNLIAKNAEESRDTEFKIQVFAADYTSGLLEKGLSVYSATVSGNLENPIASYEIPKDFLTGISIIGRHSYIVEVSSLNPSGGGTLSATAYIDIGSRPTIVRLGKLDSYLLTDQTATVPVSWTLENFDTSNDAEFKLEITDNVNNIPVCQKTETDSQGGSYQLVIPKVANGFKDIYTVTVRAKNTSDSTWSYDSFVIYVYSDASLRILIDGAAAGIEKTMSNQEKISGMSSQAILDLQRDIYLKNVISINYGEHAWGQISDQIKWRSSDSSIASINYRQGSLYENIEGFSYISYRPATEFILSGLRDGTARITATHAATGLQQTVDVQVKTLKDKLYLFQVYPQAVTTLTYVNGDGEEYSVDTNDQGALAIYEESGIKGDVFMQSTFNEREYRGTLYNERLISSEKDSTKLQLYPENNFKLHEVATAELYFKKPDGNPYQGDLILRGGVYKNGEYCPEAKLNAKDGAADQTITLGADGKLTVKMDASQFWTVSDLEVLKAQDKIDFLYEVRFPDDAYYPRQLMVSGSMNAYETVRFGASIVPLKAVAEGDAQKPFVDAQSVQWDTSRPSTDIINFTGKIGPGQSWDKVTMTTRVIWWGEAGDDAQGLHKLVFEDQYGVVPTGQTSRMIIYPFASMKSSAHTFELERNTMKDWLKPLQSRSMNLIVIDGNGNQYKKVTMPFRIINMLDTAPVEDSSSLTFLLETLAGKSSAAASPMNVTDKLIGAGLGYLSGQGVESQMFSMVVRPTHDPTVFKAFIQVDIGNMSNDNVTGVYSDAKSDDDLDYTPSASAMMDMSKGKYLKGQKDKLVQNKKQVKSKRARDISYSVGGYMEAEISYNEDKEKWEIIVLNGGFNAGGGVSYSWNYNAWVGPVPVTGQITLGATVEVIFKAAVQRGEEIKITYDEDSVNDYLTTLRLHAYVRAFAGFGVDYTVAALKIGLFGQISIDGQFAFLNQPYISDEATKGQKMTIKGKVGIEFVAKFLFVSYEKILASQSFNISEKAWNDWNYIQELWKKIGKGSSDTLDEMMRPMIMLPNGSELYPAAERAIIEDRDYLQKFDRTWAAAPGRFSMLSLDTENAVKDLQTNSYPYSYPVLTDDGQILVYISDADSSDVEKTEVRWTKLQSGSYPDGTAVEPGAEGYGDSQLKLDGTGDLAAAAWVRQSEGLSKEAGEAVTYSDVALMSNSTEIMVSVYNGATWTTTQLTDNVSPDLAPVVATNGSKVMVAWRSVYAADASEPMNFSGADSILYRIYEDGAWSEPKTLYNGTSGAVKGMDAAMLPDGTAAVTYSIDTAGTEFAISEDGQSASSSYEIVYAIVDTDGEVKTNVRLTNDSYLDQKPQITTVKFEDGLEWFVLGWHSVHDADGVSVNDIRLCAFNGEGAMHPDFIDSISSVNDNADVNIGPTFRFSKNAETIDDLSIIWSESANSGTMDVESNLADKDVLKAVRFRSDKGRIYITSAMDVAEMADFTLIDHFDAYNAGDDTVKAVISGTSYDNGYEPTGLEAVEEGGAEDLLVAAPKSNLYTATGTFRNKIEISLVAVDYKSVIRGMRIPVQFTVLNAGMQPISGITLKVGDNMAEFDGLHLLPNSSIPLTAYYDVPADKVVNPEYQVTASFDNKIPELPGEEFTQTDTLYLDIPDVGISRLDTISEEKGKRVMQISLYNYSDIQLEGGNRLVKIGFFSDSDCTQLVHEVTGQEMDMPFTVDPADHGLIDAGAYTRQFTFDLASYVGDGNEIPDGGVQLYAKAWIEEPVDPIGTEEIMEYYPNNNYNVILFESLLIRNDNQPVTISTEQINEDGATRAVVKVRNNSLVNTSSGNLIASLLDRNGNILETRQSYSSGAENMGLISLGGEETAQRTLQFDTEGVSLAMSYSNAVLDEENNANLSSLSMTGIPLKLEEGMTAYGFTTKDLANTLVSAVTEDPTASVAVNGTKLELCNAKIELRYGKNTINIVVTAADGETKKTYTVIINNNDTTHNSGNTSGTSNVDTPEGDANKITKELSKSDITDIISRTDASLRLETPFLNITLDSEALESIVRESGDKVTITVEKKDDIITVTIMVDGKVLYNINGGITAVMPVENAGSGTVAALVKADVTFEIVKNSVAVNNRLIIPLNGSTSFKVMENARNFSDTGNHWANTSVDFVSARNLFSGTSDSTFSPDASMTRGMVATVLGRLSNADTSSFQASRFNDVAGNEYYAPYVEWAARNGIVNGFGDGRFDPELAITREQLVTMLANYIEFAGYTLTDSTESPAAFTDQNRISSFANNGVVVFQRAGIISGMGNNLFNPQGTATRAEVAAILERLITNIARGMPE